MGSRDRAAEAIRTSTIEGPVRARAIRALAQVDFSGKPFTIVHEGTRRQSDAVVKVLREAGIMEPAGKPAPGMRASYRIADAYKVREVSHTRAEVRQDTHDGGVRTTALWSEAPVANYAELYELIPGVEDSWKSEEAQRAEQLRDAAIGFGVETEGKIGAAVELIIWSLACYPDGLTLQDFGLELDEVSFSDRTLKNALAELKDAGIVEVIGGGPKPALYRAILPA